MKKLFLIAITSIALLIGCKQPTQIEYVSVPEPVAPDTITVLVGTNDSLVFLDEKSLNNNEIEISLNKGNTEGVKKYTLVDRGGTAALEESGTAALEESGTKITAGIYSNNQNVRVAEYTSKVEKIILTKSSEDDNKYNVEIVKSENQPHLVFSELVDKKETGKRKAVETSKASASLLEEKIVDEASKSEFKSNFLEQKTVGNTLEYHLKEVGGDSIVKNVVLISKTITFPITINDVSNRGIQAAIKSNFNLDPTAIALQYKDKQN